MSTNDPVIEQLIGDITEDLVKSVRETVSRAIRKKLKTSLAQAWGDGEFYKRLNNDMLQGLENIFREINSAKKDADAPVPGKETKALLSEAFHQLDEVLASTEEATGAIMDIVEKHQELLALNDALADKAGQGALASGDIESWREHNNCLAQDLTNILTVLSFQDLTGQRVKKVLAALETIEGTVFDLYMRTGIALKEYAKEPEKDLEQIQDHAKKVVSELKGPSRDANQDAVDDLLAQLGL